MPIIKRMGSFEFWAFTPLATLCPAAKIKIKFVNYRKAVSFRRDKKKNIHHITAHMKKDNQTSEIIIYEGDNGQPRIEARIEKMPIF